MAARKSRYLRCMFKQAHEGQHLFIKAAMPASVVLFECLALPEPPDAKLIAQAPAMLTFLRAFVASVDYHDVHDADAFVETMHDARETAREILRAVEA